MFYMKGADVAMSSIVQYNDWLEEEVRNIANNCFNFGKSKCFTLLLKCITEFNNRNWIIIFSNPVTSNLPTSNIKQKQMNNEFGKF